MGDKYSIGQKLLLAFEGTKPSPEIISALKTFSPSGLTLFRHLNIENPGQVRELTDSLQHLAKEYNLPPLLIATDQEGGQLTAVGEGTTQLPGNMALGAISSTELAQQAGAVLGHELAAMGVNVNYAPICDVNINPKNPVIGIRSFGEDPEMVARLASAMIEGIQSGGVAATAKHFPGHGDTEGDSHHGLVSVPHGLDRLNKVEFPPFRAAIKSGVKLVMTAHLALPAIDGPNAPPSTLSHNILQGILREKLNFDGVIVTDAMDMKAIGQGDALGGEALRAVAAGNDLLLLTANPRDQQCVYEKLVDASQKGDLNPEARLASNGRVLSLKKWVSNRFQPDMGVVGCNTHQAIANEIAERSMTIVRNNDGLLPLTTNPGERIAVVVPESVDLTPADTSSYIKLHFATTIRNYHPDVDEYMITYAPGEQEIAGILERLSGYDLLILCTLNAFASPNQAVFVNQALKLGIPAVVAALRLPYDLMAFPDAQTFVCSYSILEPSMNALAKALFGQIEFLGRLPVSIPGLYESGYRASG